jgi:hypothetical protein
MVSNCDAFYKVVTGDTCDSIAAKNGISVDQLHAWNTDIGGAACSGLWANTYVCVSVIGHTPSPTTLSNGLATPSPVQDGMTRSCKTFNWVVAGDTCAAIARRYGITAAQFAAWNPAVGSDCTRLWDNTYACVGVLQGVFWWKGWTTRATVKLGGY